MVLEELSARVCVSEFPCQVIHSLPQSVAVLAGIGLSRAPRMKLSDGRKYRLYRGDMKLSPLVTTR